VLERDGQKGVPDSKEGKVRFDLLSHNLRFGHSLWDAAVDVVCGLTTRLGQFKPSDVRAARRFTIVQYGDYGEAYLRFAAGGPETYYAQKYSVDFLESLSRRRDIDTVTSIAFGADVEPTTLPNGIRTLGVELYPKGKRARHRQLLEAVRQSEPTHLMVKFPSTHLIGWAIRARIPVLPMFAGSFHDSGLKASVRHKLLSLLLNHPSIDIVANHNLAASLDLKRIGVDPTKIVPVDWPALISPRSYEAKSAPPDDRPFRLLYVGSVIEAKGVADAIRALPKIAKTRRHVELTIIGNGDLEKFKGLATAEEVEKQVHFLGPKAHPEVLVAMRDHDAVVVPSHWDYPEGLPMTLYEALCTRTPLVTSDHPMFAIKIRDHENALVFSQRNSTGLAACILELATSPKLYAKLSQVAGTAAEGFLCPVKYDQMILRFLDPVERRKLYAYSLANYPYL
jgi:glycosyltransferase involved in cell wall biosynthesis